LGFILPFTIALYKQFNIIIMFNFKYDLLWNPEGFLASVEFSAIGGSASGGNA